jgi:hypothetical protein
MAKKHHKKKHRRRMGAAGKRGLMGGLMEGFALIGGAAAGMVAGRLLNNMINPTTTITPSISPTMLGIGEAAIAAFAVGKIKSTGLKAVAVGLGANGLGYALGNAGMKILPTAIGYGPDPMHRPMAMQGFREVPKIGFPQPGAIGRTGDTGDRERARIARMYAGVYGG